MLFSSKTSFVALVASAALATTYAVDPLLGVEYQPRLQRSQFCCSPGALGGGDCYPDSNTNNNGNQPCFIRQSVGGAAGGKDTGFRMRLEYGGFENGKLIYCVSSPITSIPGSNPSNLQRLYWSNNPNTNEIVAKPGSSCNDPNVGRFVQSPSAPHVAGKVFFAPQVLQWNQPLAVGLKSGPFLQANAPNQAILELASGNPMFSNTRYSFQYTAKNDNRRYIMDCYVQGNRCEIRPGFNSGYFVWVGQNDTPTSHPQQIRSENGYCLFYVNQIGQTTFQYFEIAENFSFLSGTQVSDTRCSTPSWTFDHPSGQPISQPGLKVFINSRGLDLSNGNSIVLRQRNTGGDAFDALTVTESSRFNEIERGMPTEQVAGIAAGAAGFVGIAAAAVVMKRRRTQKQSAGSDDIMAAFAVDNESAENNMEDNNAKDLTSEL